MKEHWQARSTTPIDPDRPIESLLRARNRSINELDLGLSAIVPVRQLDGVETLAARLLDAIESKQLIAVVGDFDCDGATASVVLCKAIAAAGGIVTSIIPSRIAHGYGLSPTVVDAALASGATLIVTVDNGVSAHAGVAHAQNHGVDVLITDHHLPGLTLPPALMVNPNGPHGRFPSRALAGVGVAFYVAVELSRQAQERRLRSLDCRSLLPLVALGTVADLVPLDTNNLILVQAGVRRIRDGRGGPGIEALCRASGIAPDDVTTQDLAFSLAPRINAAGRLAEMSLGVSCLGADNVVFAQDAALALSAKNAERRAIQADGEILIQADAERQADAPAIVVWSPALHEGVVGIIAGRIRERFQKPAVVFAVRADGSAKGSARSVTSVHLRDALATVHARHPSILQAFGGHAAAAGMTVAGAALPEFADAFSAVIGEQLSQLPNPQNQLQHDGSLPGRLMTIEFARQLERVPWGQALPPPHFLDSFDVFAVREMQGGHLRLRLQSDHRVVVTAVWFNAGHAVHPGNRLTAVYTPRVNRYGGQESLQLIITDACPSAAVFPR